MTMLEETAATQAVEKNFDKLIKKLKILLSLLFKQLETDLICERI